MMKSLDARTTRQLAFALVTSLIILLGGMGWTWQIGKSSSKTAHQLGHLQAGLKSLQATAAANGAKG